MANSPQHHQQMPSPAPRPRGPKLKFTPEDDSLLVDLKENKALTWKQIAEYFPGRSSGTLQVRYCTKLKAKTTQWTDDTVRDIFFAATSAVLYFLFRAGRPSNYWDGKSVATNHVTLLPKRQLAHITGPEARPSIRLCN